ncbi:hypothetical protein TRAPUB_2728 [Trametes pubescens]|uniref:Uncharacterized protein n=1 Tax=Trametes pubescens TaxID=154538 RepID=A0A1M2VG00_TRAPU|nr:hypothetical protein TRAPUB_2728 [Trametes pubescens]
MHPLLAARQTVAELFNAAPLEDGDRAGYLNWSHELVNAIKAKSKATLIVLSISYILIYHWMSKIGPTGVNRRSSQLVCACSSKGKRTCFKPQLQGPHHLSSRRQRPILRSQVLSWTPRIHPKVHQQQAPPASQLVPLA